MYLRLCKLPFLLLRRSIIAQVAGTNPSAVTIDSIQYQVTVDLSQRPDGQRRRLLQSNGYSTLLVGPASRHFVGSSRRGLLLYLLREATYPTYLPFSLPTYAPQGNRRTSTRLDHVSCAREYLCST